MNKTLLMLLQPLLLVGFLYGCGGNNEKPAAYLPTKATLTLFSSGTNTTIHGIDATITLPAGVTVKSTLNPPETDAGVVSPSGSAIGSLTTGVYTAATGTYPGSVRVLIANGSGFSTGEFAKVACTIALGSWPDAGDFSISGFAVSDGEGNPLSDFSAGFIVEVR
jgi:hypothetical protein